MHKLGVCAPLVKYIPERSVTIVGIIGDAIVLNNDSFLDRSLYPKIIAPIRKIHSSDVRLKRIFNPLTEIKKSRDPH